MSFWHVYMGVYGGSEAAVVTAQGWKLPANSRTAELPANSRTAELPANSRTWEVKEGG